MKMIIFGATGTVGRKLVEQAVAKGYEVTAFVRHPEKWQHTHLAKVILFKGDVLNIEDVEAAVRQQEVVMCALGDGKVGKIRALGTQNIIEAMKKEGIKRLICQTTLGMGESYGNLNFFWKHLMFGILLKRAFKDHQLQEEYILNSNLDYTIVRPSALTDGAITKQYKEGFSGSFQPLSLKISRADVADFMLGQIWTAKYRRGAVSISN